MQSISVTRYQNPTETGWAGVIEPRDRSWIAFIGLDGAPRFYLHRDEQTGAVLPDDPAARPAAIEAIRAEEARRAAWVEPIEGVTYPLLPGETFCGMPAPPTP
jgi:hypothetical protein